MGTAQEGLDSVLKSRPVAILLDYRLPDMDGLQFLKLLREQSGDKLPCPVILLTGEELRDQVQEAIKLGISDYLYKGNISPINLCSTVKDAIYNERNPTLFAPLVEQKHLYWVSDNAADSTDEPKLKVFKAPILRETDRVVILDRYYPIPDLGFKKLILKSKLPTPVAHDLAQALTMYQINAQERESQFQEQLKRLQRCRTLADEEDIDFEVADNLSKA